MAHITTIGASMFSDLSVINFSSSLPSAATLQALSTYAAMSAYFGSFSNATTGITVLGSFTRITGIREFPALGTPPNIVNVPGYGSKTSRQIQGQSDAPSLELTVNYVPDEWSSTTALGKMVGDGNLRLFRFTLLNAEPADPVIGTKYSSVDTVDVGLKSAPGGNSQYFWLGKVEALQVNPQLTDATTATITLSIQSQFFGAFTTT